MAIFAAAIEYAREGFPLSPVIARGWSIDPARDRWLAPTFLPGGKRPRYGDVLKNPDLARFFETIAGSGSVGLERHIPDSVRGKLAEMGHKIRRGRGSGRVWTYDDRWSGVALESTRDSFVNGRTCP